MYGAWITHVPYNTYMTIGIYWFYQTSRDRAVYVGSSSDVASRFI